MKNFKNMNYSDMAQWFNEKYENGDICLHLTDNPDEAIYVFPNGCMIDGDFDYGCRGNDHRCIEELTNTNRYDNGFWEEVHYELGLVRIVPEYGEVLIGERQKLSKAQEEIIECLGWEISAYIK